MEIIYIVTAICVLLQAERGILDIISYLKLFHQLKQRTPENFSKKTKNPPLFIVIPVLKEQDIIVDTILSIFYGNKNNQNIKIVLATTQKETAETFSQKTTEEVVIDAIKNGLLKEYEDSILVFRDPTTNGSMATQLNYAISKLQEKFNNDAIYMTYNADSVLPAGLAQKVESFYSHVENSNSIIQQPCAFVRNINDRSSNFENALCIYQSWYCLGHESRLIYRYESKGFFSKLGILVGHGHGMPLHVHKANGGYPTHTLTEDQTFSFLLSARKVPIKLLPVMEIADVPKKLKSFIKQRTIWFWNYLGYLNMYSFLRKAGHSHKQLIPLLVQGLGGGLYWFSSSIFMVLPIIIGIITAEWTIIYLSVASTIIFVLLPQYYLFKKIPQTLINQGFKEIGSKVKRISFIRLLPSLLTIMAADSIGPWIATGQGVMYLFTGELPNKPKTED